MAYQQKYNYKKRDLGPKKNGFIKATEVNLIHNGENLGNIPIEKALQLAREADLDLVEVGAMAKPPVCKIMDYSKYLYEQKKKQKTSKGKAKAMKEFKFSPVIDIHDRTVREKRAKEYLDKGHMVRLTMQRKGRQTREQAIETFKEILTLFEDYSTIEPVEKHEGRKIFITIKPDGKTKNKQNSSKKVQAKQSERKPKAKDQIQKDSTTPSKDKKVSKGKEKKTK